MTPPADFACFILTHGRPDRVHTYRALRQSGYTGPIYLIIDTDDPTGDLYRAQYGSQVLAFNKADYSSRIDQADNFLDAPATVLPARHAVFDLATRLAIPYFLQLDDDYQEFQFRFNRQFEYAYQRVTDLDSVFTHVLDFYRSIPALTIAFAQGGDMIGGGEATYMRKLTLRRKAMNTFFCSIHRPFSFLGRMNDDVSMYCVYGMRGALLLTLYNVSITQEPTQSQSGGLTDLYQQFGTYVKSFYTVLHCPAFVSVGTIHDTYTRLHHIIDWKHGVPVLLSEQYRKPD